MQHEDVSHLDLTDCKTRLDLHERFRTTFDFPDWYGCNWSAFYDLMCTDVPSCHLVVSGAYSTPDDLKPSLSLMIEVLDKIKAERLSFNDIFTYGIVS